jgi:hypothetical protein
MLKKAKIHINWNSRNFLLLHQFKFPFNYTWREELYFKHLHHVEHFPSFVTKCSMQCVYIVILKFCFKIHPTTEIASTQSLIDTFIMIQSSDLEYQIHTLGFLNTSLFTNTPPIYFKFSSNFWMPHYPKSQWIMISHFWTQQSLT